MELVEQRSYPDARIEQPGKLLAKRFDLAVVENSHALQIAVLVIEGDLLVA